MVVCIALCSSDLVTMGVAGGFPDACGIDSIDSVLRIRNRYIALKMEG